MTDAALTWEMWFHLTHTDGSLVTGDDFCDLIEDLDDALMALGFTYMGGSGKPVEEDDTTPGDNGGSTDTS